MIDKNKWFSKQGFIAPLLVCFYRLNGRLNVTRPAVKAVKP